MNNTELHKIIVEFNDTKTDYPQDKTIVDLFEEQVERTPENIAVVFEDKQLTYRELNNKSNQLANYLQTLGVKPEVLVGICVERSLKMVIGLLGILKAGGAYVPLDPTYPKSRLAFMLEDSQVPILLTQECLVENLPKHQAQIVCLDTNWKTISNLSAINLIHIVKPNNLAYVIYTSGSTGKPKGVQIIHRSLVNLIVSMSKIPGLTADDILLSITTIAFDLSVPDIYLPLVVGAKIIIANSEEIKDGIKLLDKLKDVTFMQATPATWGLLITMGWKNNHKLKAICGGEKASIELINKLLNKTSSVWNLYGPTEATVWSTLTQINNSNFGYIGNPINNVQVYILDEYLQLVSSGIKGELYIGGVGLARGYLNHPKLTAKKFINNPFRKNSRLYKTGDLARYLPDGNIEFLGRIDNQVKMRGFRIELGEIETTLTQHPLIRETAVICPESNKLIAYIVPKLLEQDVSLQNEHISNWENIYKEVYSQPISEYNPTFNITGWNSSYTGLPIPPEEMQIWTDSTVDIAIPDNVVYKIRDNV